LFCTQDSAPFTGDLRFRSCLIPTLVKLE